jgi:ATPase family protein associated with various cellular activities (AAA)
VARPTPDERLDRLADDLGRLVQRLMERTATAARGPDARQVGDLIREHLGEGAEAMPVVRGRFSAWDQANLQIALDRALSREGWSVEMVGVSGQARHFPGAAIGDMMRGAHFPAGSVEYAEAPVGPGRTMACVDFAVLLIGSPGGSLVCFVRRGEDNPFSSGTDIELQVAAADRGRAEHLIAELRALIEEHDIYRGQVITVESSPQGTRLTFVERTAMDPGELVLPDGVIERIERHLVGPSLHRERLVAMGRHLSRGLLLYGPPGTGKTHTVRYLTGRLRDATVIVLAGGALGAIGAFGSVARRLAPSVVILEDVDLVAEDRYDPDGGSTVLFELMDQMSGLGEDADVAFVLTTNRPDALEPALAARPGRVDLAVQIPLPDAVARGRLLDLYARGLDLQITDRDGVIARTEGVTASFVKELLRAAALVALEDGREAVSDADMTAALDELLAEGAALTRILLGSGGDEAPRPGSEWMSRFPRDDEGGGAFAVVVSEPE